MIYTSQYLKHIKFIRYGSNAIFYNLLLTSYFLSWEGVTARILIGDRWQTQIRMTYETYLQRNNLLRCVGSIADVGSGANSSGVVATPRPEE